MAAETPVPDAKLAVLQEISAELKKQSELKKEILAEVKPRSWLTTVLDVTKHPILLLALGSVLGTVLTSRYQAREWDRQQHVLQERQKADQKVDAQNQIIEELVEAYAAARNAVRPLFYEDAATFKSKADDRLKEWDKASQKWQVSQARLEQRLADFFKDPNARSKLREVLNLRNPRGNPVFVEVNNVLGTIRQNPIILDQNVKPATTQSPDLKEFRDNIRHNILIPTDEARTKIDELKQLLQTEIHKDLENDDRPSFWSHLFG